MSKIIRETVRNWDIQINGYSDLADNCQLANDLLMLSREIAKTVLGTTEPTSYDIEFVLKVIMTLQGIEYNEQPDEF